MDEVEPWLANWVTILPKKHFRKTYFAGSFYVNDGRQAKWPQAGTTG